MPGRSKHAPREVRFLATHSYAEAPKNTLQRFETGVRFASRRSGAATEEQVVMVALCGEGIIFIRIKTIQFKTNCDYLFASQFYSREFHILGPLAGIAAVITRAPRRALPASRNSFQATL